MTRKRWIAVGGAVVLALVAVAVVLVSSGGGDDASGLPAEAPAGFEGAPEGGAPPGFGELSEELQSCLEEQGVELDPGSGPAQGQPDADMAEALQACQEYLPEAPSGGDFPAPPSG